MHLWSQLAVKQMFDSDSQIHRANDSCTGCQFQYCLRPWNNKSGCHITESRDLTDPTKEIGLTLTEFHFVTSEVPICSEIIPISTPGFQIEGNWL
eukprot:g13495.t1